MTWAWIEQIPEVPIEVPEHRYSAIGLSFRLTHELHATVPECMIVASEIVDPPAGAPLPALSLSSRQFIRQFGRGQNHGGNKT
jgi:hypothetical protein